MDDDPDCRRLVRDIIDAAGARADVREAANGQQALDYLHRSGPFADAPRPDLIYLDVQMPGLTGQQVLQRIKADPDLREIPVVMLTGVDDDAHRLRALSGGASGYVAKPAHPRRFLRTVSASVAEWLTPHQRAGKRGPRRGEVPEAPETEHG